MKDNIEQSETQTRELREKAKLDEERTKDLQKQAIEAGKKKDKNNVGNAVKVAATALTLAGMYAYRK